MKKNNEDDFCSICGHMIPSIAELGGRLEGTLVNFVNREVADVALHLCSECIGKLIEIESGGLSKARLRSRTD